ncbi:ABC transporter permease [Haloarcula amylovorans]|uniref:ABC transporter permease n=1 Tax=Haloarcula amylovorans TaxID=2562280 RepID=UPI0010760B7B|nr:ABC transporter permease [Halomicroarcula amylolytica]
MSTDTDSGLRNALDFSRDEAILFVLDNMIWPILLITILIFSAIVPIFSSVGNIRALLFGTAALSAIVLGETLCLLSGHFDLSVGASAGFSAIFTAVLLTEWFPGTPGIVGIAIVLLVGMLIGLINGVSITYIGVNPFLQTLAMLMILSGSIQLLSSTALSGLPETYLFVGGGQIGTIPVAIVLMGLLYLAFGIWLKYSATGRAIYAVGGNKKAATEAGINTTFIVVLVYVFSGMLAALGGLLYTGFLGVAPPTIGQNDVFPAFAAAVIGGVSLFGGRGNVLGAVGGVVLLASVESALVLMGIEATAVDVINGFVLLIAIILYTMEERIRQRVITKY